MMPTEDEVMAVLRQIETGDVTLVLEQDPQEQIKGDILYRASNGWTIEVSNWSGEFAGIVEIGLPDGSILDMDHFDRHMPGVAEYFPDEDVAWRAYRMKAVETGFIYLSEGKLGRFADAEEGTTESNPSSEPPWIIVDHSLRDVTVARWPGRLWLAQVLERLEPQGHRGNYTRCTSVKIVREMPTHYLFGPYGEQVEQVLRFAGGLDRGGAERLASHRHPDAAELTAQGWHRWQALVTGTENTPDRDMRGVVRAANNLKSPVGHGLSLAHGAVWDAAERIDGAAAFEEDEDERRLIGPWAAAGSAMLETVWGLGAPELFDVPEREKLLRAWQKRPGHDEV
ncbi:hypothetical protein [uncultured Hyphomonas sp.]|uniref:hypothetical protein n=1 Tax=uncultured Hyphomonas sp. TaxID=225298 RepID=UPI002AAADB5B|nr:hypothetical protein [uncultured Hyphomonas sp.]